MQKKTDFNVGVKIHIGTYWYLNLGEKKNNQLATRAVAFMDSPTSAVKPVLWLEIKQEREHVWLKCECIL